MQTPHQCAAALSLRPKSRARAKKRGTTEAGLGSGQYRRITHREGARLCVRQPPVCTQGRRIIANEAEPFGLPYPATLLLTPPTPPDCITYRIPLLHLKPLVRLPRGAPSCCPGIPSCRSSHLNILPVGHFRSRRTDFPPRLGKNSRFSFPCAR